MASSRPTTTSTCGGVERSLAERVPAAVARARARVEDTADGPYWLCGVTVGCLGWRQGDGRPQRAALGLERGGVLEPGVPRPRPRRCGSPTCPRRHRRHRDVRAHVPLLIKDPELRQVCYRAYNDWLAEFAPRAAAPDRRGADPDDEPSAADEVRHLTHLGLARACCWPRESSRRSGTRPGSRSGRPRRRRGFRRLPPGRGPAPCCGAARVFNDPGNMGVRALAPPRWTSRWPR